MLKPKILTDFRPHKSYTNPLAARRKPAAQTAHLFFAEHIYQRLKKIKELFLSTAKKTLNLM